MRCFVPLPAAKNCTGYQDSKCHTSCLEATGTPIPVPWYCTRTNILTLQSCKSDWLTQEVPLPFPKNRQTIRKTAGAFTNTGCSGINGQKSDLKCRIDLLCVEQMQCICSQHEMQCEKRKTILSFTKNMKFLFLGNHRRRFWHDEAR